MKRPPSPCQHFNIGKSSREKLSLRIISLHGPDFTYFGAKDVSSTTSGIFLIPSHNPEGGSNLRSFCIRSAISSRLSTSSARHIRSIVPKAFANTGSFDPDTFSNNRAGPPFFTTLSRISVISSSALTCVFIRLRSPFFSRSSINSRKSL